MRRVLLLLCAAVSLGAAGARTDRRPAGPGAGQTDVPVLLIPGWFDTEREMAALRIRLVSAGWEPDHVAAVDFREPTGSNRDHAGEIADAAHALLERTGHDELDVVAHSMGGLAVRWLLRQPGAPPVRRVAFIASPHRGTLSAYVAWGDGSTEMLPGSAFLDSLNAVAAVPEGVQAITVRTPVDTHIIPGESATLPGITDHVVCCPTHAGLLRDLEVFRIVRRFLNRGES